MQSFHLPVAVPSGASKWRRRVEVRAAEEDNVYGNVVRDELDNPPEFRHHALDPILDLGVVIRWHRRLAGRIWFA
jgi:hypothetical protein